MNQIILKTDYDRERLLHYVRNLDISRAVVFSWKLWKGKRSLSSNDLLHVWIREMLKHPYFANNVELKKQTKTQREEGLKTSLKKRFLGYETVTYADCRTGEEKIVERLRKTSDLDSGEFCFFMEQVQAWALHYLGTVLTCDKNDEFAKWQEEQAA